MGRVSRGSTAQDAGLRPGDVIIALNGETISSDEDLMKSLAEKEIGGSVKLEVIRGQQEATINVRVQSMLDTSKMLERAKKGEQ